MGLPPVKHAVFREEVRVIHDLLRDGEATYNTEGMSKKIRYIHRDRRFISLDGPIPFYVAANGPKTIALAGEFGDGCVTTGVINPERVEAVKKHLQAGAAQAKRKLPDKFPIVTLTHVCVLQPGEDLDSPRVKTMCGPWVMANLHAFAAGYARAESLPAPVRPVFQAYMDYVVEDEDAARRALSRTPSRALLLCGTGGVEIRHAGIDRMLHHRGTARESGRADSRIGEGRAIADFPQSTDGRIRRLHRRDRPGGL